jgi:hypothetical protein
MRFQNTKRANFLKGFENVILRFLDKQHTLQKNLNYEFFLFTHKTEIDEQEIRENLESGITASSNLKVKVR